MTAPIYVMLEYSPLEDRIMVRGAFSRQEDAPKKLHPSNSVNLVGVFLGVDMGAHVGFHFDWNERVKDAIVGISSWLSASLSPMNGGSHVACKEYEEACNKVLDIAIDIDLERNPSLCPSCNNPLTREEVLGDYKIRDTTFNCKKCFDDYQDYLTEPT